MGPSWCVCLTLFFFYEVGSSEADTAVMEMSGIHRGSLTFSLGVPAEQFKSAAWTVNQTNPIVSIGAGNPPTVLVTHSSYEGRLRASPENYSLQITNLRLEDTGTYRAQITISGSTIYKQFRLHVYREVPVPTIACDSVTCENETCNYNLTCAVGEGGENVTYNWTYNWTHQTGGAVVSSGPILNITQGPPDSPMAVTCTAQNPVSNRSTTVKPKDFCAVNSPESQSARKSRITGIVLAVIVVMVAVIVVLVVWNKNIMERVMQKRHPGSAGGTGADVENNTVYAQVGNFPQPSNFSRKGKQNEGPETKDEESKTIYSTVNLPNQSPPQTDDEKLQKAGPESMENEKTIYCTANQPVNAQGTEVSNSKHADEFANTPRPNRTEYNMII